MGLIDILTAIARRVLRLRYHIEMHGLGDVTGTSTSAGTLFLPNHPALIDPLILFSELRRDFQPVFLADRDQIQKPLIRTLASKAGVIEMPSLSLHGEKARAGIEEAMQRCAGHLRSGGAVVLYPSGHLYRSRLEHLGANSAVERLLALCPDTRVVLVRTTGLWGSSFSRGQGRAPEFFNALLRGLVKLALAGIFFAPRRRVRIEFQVARDLTSIPSRAEQNARLEAFYNQEAPPAWYVPYTPWERGGERALPEPESARWAGEWSDVPESTRAIVLGHLRELTGRATIKEEDSLSADLGLDSLARVELALWIEREFGHPVGTEDLLQSAGDVLLAACGNVMAAGEVAIRPPDPAWFNTAMRVKEPGLPAGDDLLEVFLRRARANPGAWVAADESSGLKRYRDLLTGILALRPAIREMPGRHVGIMLPASVGASVVYLATLASGKIPVMVNWTVGERNVRHSLDLLSVDKVITSRKLVERLAEQGIRLEGLKDRFVAAEDLRAGLTTLDKLRAAVGARLGARELDRVRPPDVAVVLFTSGSESLPKAVPLTHANLLANMRDIEKIFSFRAEDVLIAMLPPFHSFGINVTTLYPLLLGIRVLFHPNPTEGGRVAKLIEAYHVTLMVGTPTFLNGILRAGQASQFAHVRAVIAGAEKCPDHVYDKVREIAPSLTVVEGYGITECSPVVSINDWRNPKPGTIGKALPGVVTRIVSPDTMEEVPPGERGLLLVRGASIFGGYANYEGPSPFVEVAGASWYKTGDLVSQDAEGVLTFRGRLKRFVKIGGEMISLPAIEEALLKVVGRPDDDRPVLAVEGTPVETNPELVLFTTSELDRERANGILREAGLSPLHFIRRIIRVDEIPLLGTGKTDYRKLKDLLDRDDSRDQPGSTTAAEPG